MSEVPIRNGAKKKKIIIPGPYQWVQEIINDIFHDQFINTHNFLKVTFNCYIKPDIQDY